MKTLLLAAIFFISFSCINNRNKEKQVDEESGAINAPILDIVDGVWVKSDYIEELKQTKSPAKSFDKLEGIATLIIDPANILDDTLTVGVSINNHEGGFFHALVSADEYSMETDIRDHESKTSSIVLTYQTTPPDTISVVLLKLGADGLPIRTTKFSKVCENQSRDKGADYGIQLIVNKLLFEGTYIFKDSLGHQQTAKFEIDGVVEGLEDYKTYEVITDFATEVDFLDMICFEEQCFSFAFTNNILKLFETSVNNEHNSVLGKLKYELVKQ